MNIPPLSRCDVEAESRPGPVLQSWLLTADQFDEVEIREVSCFGAVPMKSGIPAAEHTLLRSATAKRISWSFRSICYCGTAMAVTHSYGRASISQNPGSASQQNRPLDFR